MFYPEEHVVSHNIVTEPGTRVKLRLYRIPEAKRAEVDSICNPRWTVSVYGNAIRTTQRPGYFAKING